MAIKFAEGVADKIRAEIGTWGITNKATANEIWEQLEALDENPYSGTQDPDGFFGGAFFYQFVIDRPPLARRFTVAYDIHRRARGHDVVIVDFVRWPTP